MFVYGQDVKDKSRYLFGYNSCDPKQIFFAKTLDLINNNQPKSINLPINTQFMNTILHLLKPLMSEIDFDGCVYWNLNQYSNFIWYMTDMLKKFNTNELMNIDLKTLTHQQQFILFKTLQRKDSVNYVQENDIRDSLAGHYRNSNWSSCTWDLQQHQNKQLVDYLLKFITRDDVLPETKLLLAVYFNINNRNRKPCLDRNDEVQIVTKNFADLNSLLDAILAVYSKIKDGKSLRDLVQEIINNIIGCYGIEKIIEEIIEQDDKDKLFLLLKAFEGYNFEALGLNGQKNEDYYNVIRKAEFACKILLDKKNLAENYKTFLLSHIEKYIKSAKQYDDSGISLKYHPKYYVDYTSRFEYKHLDQIKNFIGIDLLTIKNPNVPIEIKKKIYEEAKQCLDKDKKVWDTILDMYIAKPSPLPDDGYDPERYNRTNLDQLRNNSKQILSSIKDLEKKKEDLNKQYENDKPKLNWIWFTVVGTIYYVGKLIYLYICFRINKNKLESDINKQNEEQPIVKLKQAEDKQKKWRCSLGENKEKSEVYKYHETYCSLLSSIINAYKELDISEGKEQTEVKNNLPEQAEQLKPKIELEAGNIIQPINPTDSKW